MGMISVIIVTVFATVVGLVIAQDIMSWTPKICEFFVRQAVLNLKEELRERYFEEWAAHLEQTPGVLLKITEAFGFLVAAKSEKLSMKWHLLRQLLTLTYRSYRNEIKLCYLIPLKIAAMRRKLEAFPNIAESDQFQKVLLEVSKRNDDGLLTQRQLKAEIFCMLKEVISS